MLACGTPWLPLRDFNDAYTRHSDEQKVEEYQKFIGYSQGYPIIYGRMVAGRENFLRSQERKKMKLEFYVQC